MELAIISNSNQKSKIVLADESFAVDFNEGLVHQVVTAYRNGGRAGTRAQKTRAEVSGGGKKPWRQKGTGRARAGTTRGPLWRSGGVTFAAKPQNHSQKVNRKMYRAALRAIFSELIRQDRLIVVDEWRVTQPKTKELLAKLKQANIDSSVLIVTEQMDPTLELAARNVYKIGMCQSTELGPVHLIQYEKVLITADALKKIEERLV